MFTVGAFARLAGVSAKALRAYDAAGLFQPVRVDPWTAYRYYSAAQLPELRRILALRQTGMGLTEIGRLVSGAADLAAALDRRRSELRLERAEAERRLAALEIQVEMATGPGGSFDVVIRRVPAELVAALALDPDGDEGTAFYELEAWVRDQGCRAQGPPGALVGDGPDDGQGTVFYVPLTRAVPSSDRIAMRRLPGALVACIIHRGGYADMPAPHQALERWVATTGRRVDGALRILYLQFGAEPELSLPPGYVVDEPASYVTELQLPLLAAGA